MIKGLRIIGKVLLVFFSVLFLFLAVSIAPVDRTLPQDQPYYAAMMQRIDSIKPVTELRDEGFYVGFGKASITPGYPTSTAGYVKRKGAHFTGIRDSIFVRTMVLQQEEKVFAVISLDMLIVPPIVYERLSDQLPSINYSINQIYLGATHTHNSIGQWDDHLVGETFAGNFNPGLVDFVVAQILNSIQRAEADKKLATLKHGSVEVREAVKNRLIKDGDVDPLLHILEVERADGTKGIFTSFSAHATCMSSKDLRLSRDYPGEWVDGLESSGYTFAMFMAGAVGSHAPMSKPDGDEKIEAMSNLLVEAVHQAELKPIEKKALHFFRVPLLLGKRQIKILPGWRAREWLSLLLMGRSTPSLTALQIGEVVMLGTPCDFSGMLTKPIYAAGEFSGKHVFVTSFNGSYIGYITPDEYYDLEKYETQTMNWYGPGNGTYLQECLIRLMRNTGY